MIRGFLTGGDGVARRGGDGGAVGGIDGGGRGGGSGLSGGQSDVQPQWLMTMSPVSGSGRAHRLQVVVQGSRPAVS